MPVLGKTVGYTIRGVRGTTRWTGRRIRALRTRGGAGEVGMIRLLDLHAASCAGDTLVTMGLAGTIFFSVPAGEARGKVALYLLLTMAPFALLAPLIGPLLDRFRHGRRWALAATMLGRAFLAWLISDYLDKIGLYPAAFGVLVLSRAYGVARSAAVPRLLPQGLGLSEAGARASVYGAVAGALVAPLGVAAFWIGPQWPLRIATVIFVIGMVTALRLPPPADSAPPEVVPRIFLVPGRSARKVLSGRLVTSTLAGGAVLRGLFGFLALFLAFAIRSDHLHGDLFGITLHQNAALGLVAGALGAGSLIATAAGTRLKIRRPAQLQGIGMIFVAATGLLAVIHFSLLTTALFCLVTAIVGGLAKLAVDATIQERVAEDVRASAFAHSETLLMMAWVVGGAIGLIPLGGRWGIAAAAVVSVLAAARALVVAARLRAERLTGTASVAGDATTQVVPPPAAPKPEAARRWRRTRSALAERGPRPAPDDEATRRAGEPRPTVVIERTDDDLPTYHLYRPSGGPADGDAGR